jgi:FkbM family methyltransferase
VKHNGMNTKFIWEKVRLVNRLPGAYALYRVAMNLAYRDGRLATLRRGPAAGYRWRHRRGYQTWMAMGLYEPHVAQLIHDTLRPGDVFYDIGANAGYFTLVAAKAVGAGGLVVAFDPHPGNVAMIQEQIDLNDLSHICRVEPLAIAGACGTLAFVLTSRSANAHLQEAGSPHVQEQAQAEQAQTVAVRAVTLDDYVRDHAVPALIKMDIEGAEVAALEGARHLLAHPQAPEFLVSTHSDALEDGVKRILAEHGYRFRNLAGFEQMVCALPPHKTDPTEHEQPVTSNQ